MRSLAVKQGERNGHALTVQSKTGSPELPGVRYSSDTHERIELVGNVGTTDHTPYCTIPVDDKCMGYAIVAC